MFDSSAFYTVAFACLDLLFVIYFFVLSYVFTSCFYCISTAHGVYTRKTKVSSKGEPGIDSGGGRPRRALFVYFVCILPRLL